jgi:hypothetical protein
MKLVEQRGSKNPMYRMADRFQASLVIKGILTIQGIYEGVAAIVDNRGSVFTVDDLNKLTNSYNRAMASVNQALSKLGVTGDKREEKPDVDSLAQALSQYNLDDEIPPGLQAAYLSSRKEIERADGSGAPASDLDSGRNHEEALSIIKEPLKSYIETDDPQEEVIDVERDKVTVL